MWEWREYVPVAQRRAQAERYVKRLAKEEGRQVEPIEIAGRTIAQTFWGKAWCDNLESYSDFANRLPRGRTYVRNGSVVDLQIQKGQVTAVVGGSDVYEITVGIAPLPAAEWKKIVNDCSQSIDSLMDLLQGRFSKGVMERLTRQKGGLFPRPKDIDMDCTCPDYAGLCKHIAAALYGVGARLDSAPELLFLLRQVDHLELIGQALEDRNLEAALGGTDDDTLADEDLGALFGIELEDEAPPSKAKKSPVRRKRSKTSSTNGKRTATKKASAARKTTPAKTKSTKKKSTKKKSTKKKSTTRVSTKKNAPRTTGAAGKTAAKKSKKSSKRSSRKQTTAQKTTRGGSK